MLGKRDPRTHCFTPLDHPQNYRGELLRDGAKGIHNPERSNLTTHNGRY